MYFLRMASAYRGLGQLPRAIDILTQGTTKYPTSVTLWRYTGQALSDAGQTEQALVALQRSISLVPNDVSILLQIATIYDRQNQPDSVYAVVARAATIPRTDSGNMELMAKLVLKVGTTVFTAATESKRRDDYQKAIEYLQLANTLAPSIDAQFLIGASSFNLMKSVATAANHSKSCALAQLAQRAANDAQANLSVGVKDQKYHDGAQQMLQRLHQFIPAINKQIKQLCH
jgi:tetratricopeptide (TPR) repeat protein